MADFPQIPEGMAIPLVDTETFLFPEPTMDALSATIGDAVGAEVPPAVAAVLNDEPTLLQTLADLIAGNAGIYLMRGVLLSGTDLDTLDSQSKFGVYQLLSGGTYANRPTGTSGVAVLEVFGSANAVIQRISHTGLGYDWVRNKLSAGAWTVWTPVYASRGALPPASNLGLMSGVSHSGFYRLSAANMYVGAPESVAGVEAVLEVLYASTLVIQRVTPAGGAVVWQRIFSSGWSAWVQIGGGSAGGIPSTFVGTASPEASVASGAEYAWFKTDGNGNLIDILVGKKA